MAKPKKEFGMGLDALFSENDTGGLTSRTLRLTEISPNKNQPRREFDGESLATLAESIRQHGVLQPILVRPLPDGGYQIVAGERRWRASRLAGLDEIPVYVKELTDEQTARLALVENLQREDLNPVEEALGYRSLMEQTGATQEEVAKAVGKSRPAVANSLRLLSLGDKILEYVKNGDVSPGHARALLQLDDPAEQEALAQRIKRGELSVRETEELVRKGVKKPAPTPKKRESIYHEVELALRETAGRVCSVRENKSGGGTVSIEFYDKEDLMSIARLLEKLSGKE